MPYDQQWSKLSAFRDGLHVLLGAVLKQLPVAANVLCVGAATGAEIQFLAQQFPGWTFTAVEPSGRMLEVCRQRAQASGFASRCVFHEGYLHTLPPTAPFDAATCFLVSQFIQDDLARTQFFRSIADRLRPGGVLASSDLSSDTHSPTYPSLLAVWLTTMATTDLSPADIARMRTAYERDVAILSADKVESILVAGGFESPVQFFQAGLIRAWYSRRAP